MKKILLLIFIAFFSLNLRAQTEPEKIAPPDSDDKLIELNTNIQVQIGLKNWSAAIESHDRMLEIYGKQTESENLRDKANEAVLYVRMSRGRCYFEKGDYDAALVDYNYVIEKADYFWEPFLYRGELFLRKGEYESARRDLDKAVGQTARNVPAYPLRAELNFLTKNYEASIADATEALKFRPKEPAAFYFRAFSYIETGQYQLALDDFSEYLKLTSGDAKVYLKRAEAFRGLGLINEAVADEKRAEELKYKEK